MPRALALSEEFGKHADRVTHCVWPRFAQPLGNGRMPQNPDDSYAGTPSHFHVLRCVSNIDAGAGFAPKLANGELKLQGMRLAMRHTVAENTHGKKRLQSTRANLRAY